MEGYGGKAVAARAHRVGFGAAVDEDAALGAAVPRVGAVNELLYRTDRRVRDDAAEGFARGGRVVRWGPFHRRERILY